MENKLTTLPYWGKADPDYDGEHKWHPFAYHSLDVAAVAMVFWNGSPAIRQAFKAAFPCKSDEQLRAWVLFFVVLHDIGKLHALFQIKAPDVVAEIWSGVDLGKIRNQPYDHGCDGYAQADSEIADWIGTNRPKRVNAFAGWLAAVCGHHGSICKPDNDKIIRGYAVDELRQRDKAARRAWVDQAAELFLAPAGLSLGDVPPDGGAAGEKFLAGFCSLCDWIGSNTSLFGYRSPSKTPEEYFAWAERHVANENALQRFGLVSVARPFPGVSSLLKADETPRGIQTLVDGIPAVGALTILEAPTGSGKTEAALAHAWRLLESGAADSIVFALPTQATANAMLSRAKRFADHAYGSANLVLAHGNRDFHDEFRRLVDAARPSNVQQQEEAGVQCSAWLASSRKRVFLGQIGVCTVDQVLLSVLPVRHSFVRAFGLNRSVLIVDEVHAYDAYMNGLLEEVLSRQKATGGSAILLSATLPAAVRAGLLEAWDCENPADAPYPVLWAANQGNATALTPGPSEQPEKRVVEVELCKLEDCFPDDALQKRIIDGARSGAMVGIVMNTVDDAQRLARLLSEKAEELPVDLFHARYRFCDRQEIEREVIARYGREADRSNGRILVATQVIEQSLDLDFDWLLTQLCPVDLLFQRLGRLHRHERTRPLGFEHTKCTVMSIEENDYGLHGLIYGDARLLWRTEKLLARNVEIRFPAAYRDWIEGVYSEDSWDDEPEKIMGEHMAWRDDCRLAAARARQLTTMSISEFRDEDSRATSLTRDGEMSLSLLPLLSDGQLLDGNRIDSIEERDRPELLLLNTVPAPASWEDRLHGCREDDDLYDGRFLIEMTGYGEAEWCSTERRLRYSIDYGLEKTDESS